MESPQADTVTSSTTAGAEDTWSHPTETQWVDKHFFLLPRHQPKAKGGRSHLWIPLPHLLCLMLKIPNPAHGNFTSRLHHGIPGRTECQDPEGPAEHPGC